jgi:hypothetical protein
LVIFPLLQCTLISLNFAFSWGPEVFVVLLILCPSSYEMASQDPVVPKNDAASGGSRSWQARKSYNHDELSLPYTQVSLLWANERIYNLTLANGKENDIVLVQPE